MINWLRGIDVVENHETITVTGIDGRDLAKFVTRVWKTSTIDTYMFKKVNRTSIEFYKFFLIDVVYILERLSEARNPRVPARTLKQIVDAIKQKTWFKDVESDVAGRLDFTRLNDFTFKAKDYQQRFFEYYDKTPTKYKLNGALLNMVAGSGKSFSSTAALYSAKVDKIIVVCPKNALIRVWWDDPHLFFKKPPKIWNTNMNHPPKGDEYMLVYHYEALESAIIDNKHLFGKVNFGLILDESHNLNDVGSQRTQRWLELCRLTNSTNIIHMSGTPFKAIGSESIPLFRAIDSMFTPKVEEAFKKIYGTSAKRGLDILKNRLGITSFVVEKSELGLDKPDIRVMGVKTPDSKRYTLSAVREAMQKFIQERLLYYKAREEKDLAFYKQCLDIHRQKIKGNRQQEGAFDTYLNYVGLIQRSRDLGNLTHETKYCKRYEFTDISNTLPKELVKEFRNVCPVIKYLSLKIQGECLGTVVGRLRIEAHKSMCNHIPFRDICMSTKKKTVVFTSYVDVLESSFNACKKDGLNPILVYGKTNNNLAAMIKQFEVDAQVNPLIATYDSLSTAVPLIMADTMIMINAPFRSYIQEQAISRIHRLNQDSQTVVYQCYLDTGEESNISSRSLDIMKWSQEQVELITGVKSPYVLEENGNELTISAESYLEESLSSVVSFKDNTVDIIAPTKPSRNAW